MSHYSGSRTKVSIREHNRQGRQGIVGGLKCPTEMVEIESGRHFIYDELR